MSARIPRLEVIEAFIEAAQAPTFRIAAERCALSPAAFSRRIQAFTTFVGANVFERHSGGMRLTQAGRDCHDALEPIYREMKRAALAIGAASFTHKITISLSHSLAVGWLIPRLKRYRARFPHVDVTIMTLRTAEAVRGGEADLGVCARDVDVSGLHVESLLHMDIAPVACPAIADAFRRGATRLEQQPLLGLKQHPGLWEWWADEANIQHCGRLQESVTYDVIQAMYETAATGFGVAPGLSVTVSPYLQSGRLVSLGLPTVHYPHAYRLAAMASRLRTPHIAAFWAWLIDEAKAERRESAAEEYARAFA